MAIKTFKRIETKYVISQEQLEKLRVELEKHMEYDSYCQNGHTYLVQNVYFDTSTNTLISKSISKPKFKFKIRVRHYKGTNNYFLELKQKTDGVVSKRRVSLNNKEYEDLLKSGYLPEKENYLDKQIEKEFNFIFSKFNLVPAVYISYERIAMFSKDDKELRLTFDKSIKASRRNLSFDQENPEINLLDDNNYVLEIKYNANYPLWLVKSLNELKIYHNSFSKYGEEYKKYLLNEE